MLPRILRLCSPTGLVRSTALSASREYFATLAMSGDFLTNQFLIAMPAMTDGNFAQTVTFIWEHNADGALGIIINRPLQMRLADVFEQLKMPTAPRRERPSAGPAGRARADRSRLRRASDRRAVGAHAPGVLAHPGDDLARHPRRHGARQRPGDGAGRARLRGLERRTARERARTERLADGAVRRAHPVRHAVRATLARRRPPARHRPGDHQPATSDMPDGGRTRPAAAAATDPRVRFRNAPHRRRQRRHADAHGARPHDARLRSAARPGPRSTRSAPSTAAGAARGRPPL